MVMVNGCNADKMWQTLSKCLLKGKFPECIISIKINLFDDRHNGDSLEKINVVTSDFTNENEVRKAELAILHCVQKSENSTACIKVMKYKADLYTHVNIFKNNKFGGRNGIQPSMYVSKDVNRAGTRLAMG